MITYPHQILWQNIGRMIGEEIPIELGGERVDYEAFERGLEVVSHLRTCRDQIEAIAEYNPGIDISSIRIVIDKSLDLEVTPALPIMRETRRIERSSRDTLREFTEETFVLKLSTAVPIRQDDGQIGLILLGSSEISPEGVFYSYELDPLAGHSFSAEKVRESEKYPSYTSGIACLTGNGDGGKHTFVIY